MHSVSACKKVRSQCSEHLMGSSPSRTSQCQIQQQSVSVQWIEDDMSSVCMKCGHTFSLVRRKHHCRCCGGIFCSRCANLFESLPELGYEGHVRHCLACVRLKNRRDDIESRLSAGLEGGDVLSLIKVVGEADRLKHSSQDPVFLRVGCPHPVTLQRAKRSLRVQVSRKFESLIRLCAEVLSANTKGSDPLTISRMIRDSETFIEAIMSLESRNTDEDLSYLPETYSECISRLDEVSRLLYALDLVQRREHAEQTLRSNVDELGYLKAPSTSDDSKGTAGGRTFSKFLVRTRSNSVYSKQRPENIPKDCQQTYVLLQKHVTDARVAGVCNQTLLQEAESKLNILYSLCDHRIVP